VTTLKATHKKIYRFVTEDQKWI